MINQSEAPKETSSRDALLPSSRDLIAGSIHQHSQDPVVKLGDDEYGESGNIFIYIIGAIFLIGILTALVRGSSTPGSSIDQEDLILKATQVRAYAAELERAVSFVLQNAHSETEISFAHPNHSSAYGTYGTTPTAEVFNPSGGGVEWRDNDSDIQAIDTDWLFTSANEIDGIGSACANATCTDLVSILSNISQDMCILLNDNLNINNPGDPPPQNTGTADIVSVFTGAFAYVSTIADSTDNLQSKSEGCFEGSGTPAAGTYHYYKVLLAR